MKTKCAVCDSEVIVNEGSDRDPYATRYWACKKDGSIRPYCDMMCAIFDLNYIKDNKNEIISNLFSRSNCRH